MITKSRYFEAPRRLRAFVRAHETSLVVLAALVGTLAGLVVAAMGAAVEAGRKAFLAGRIEKKLYANASSPLAGVVR